MMNIEFNKLSDHEQYMLLKKIDELWHDFDLDAKEVAFALDLPKMVVCGLIAKYIMTDEEMKKLEEEYMAEIE
jgi:hypothetical protein